MAEEIVLEPSRLSRIERKIDGIQASYTDLRVIIARQVQAEENHQHNIERFWNTSWPEFAEKIDNNATRIGEMEVKIAQLSTKIMIWGATLTVGVPILAVFLQHAKW